MKMNIELSLLNSNMNDTLIFLSYLVIPVLLIVMSAIGFVMFYKWNKIRKIGGIKEEIIYASLIAPICLAMINIIFTTNNIFHYIV